MSIYSLDKSTMELKHTLKKMAVPTSSNDTLEEFGTLVAKFDLLVRDVTHDGNCLFHCLAGFVTKEFGVIIYPSEVSWLPT